MSEKLKSAGQAAAPEPDAAPQSEPAPELQPTEIRMVVTPPNSLRLNLREGPSKTFAVLDQLPAGTEVTVVELPYGTEVPGWLLVHMENHMGWAAAEFLQPAGD